MKRRRASGGAANQAASASPTYIARVALDGSRLKVDGKMEPLKPGMAVIAAEIKTGSRRILQYLLSPLRQYAEDSIKEQLTNKIRQLLFRGRQCILTSEAYQIA